MRKVALIVVVLLLVVAVVPAAAKGKPLDVEIVSVETFDPPGGVFNASGSAVPGLICESGTTEVKSWAWHKEWRTASSIKKFTCDDNGGIFYVKLEIKFTDTGTWANWVVVDWAEDPSEYDLSELKGQGRLIGVRDVPPGAITDTYTGQLH